MVITTIKKVLEASGVRVQQLGTEQIRDSEKYRLNGMKERMVWFGNRTNQLETEKSGA